MYKLKYVYNNNDVEISFSTLETAFDAARALDELKQKDIVNKIQVANAEDGVYLIPRKKETKC